MMMSSLKGKHVSSRHQNCCRNGDVNNEQFTCRTDTDLVLKVYHLHEKCPADTNATAYLTLDEGLFDLFIYSFGVF